MRGPCGNGWSIEELKGKNIIVIGGGFEKFVCVDGPVFSHTELKNMPKEY